MTLICKTFVITGGTSGIGREIVRQLSEKGHTLIVLASHQERLEQLSREHSDVLTIRCDLSKSREIEKAADFIQKNHSVDVLINNASVQYEPEFLSDHFHYDHIQKEIDINLTSVCQLVYLLLPSLLKSKNRPQILNVTSGLGLVPKRTSAVYCATKAGISALTKSLRYQLYNSGILVQQAFVPLTETRMTKDRKTNMKKARPEDVAEAILEGLEKRILDHFIGSTKILFWLHRIAPGIAEKILKKN